MLSPSFRKIAVAAPKIENGILRQYLNIQATSRLFLKNKIWQYGRPIDNNTQQVKFRRFSRTESVSFFDWILTS